MINCHLDAHLTNSLMASLARSVPLACACFAALEAASLTAAGAGCQSGGPCNIEQTVKYINSTALHVSTVECNYSSKELERDDALQQLWGVVSQL